MADFTETSDVALADLASHLHNQREQLKGEYRGAETAGAASSVLEAIRAREALVGNEQQELQKEIIRRRTAVAMETASAAAAEIISALAESQAADYSNAEDIIIKQMKSRLYNLRQRATPEQDGEIKAEMVRLQGIISFRQRARTLEYQRIAAETPGAVSAFVSLDAPAEVGSNAPATGA